MWLSLTRLLHPPGGLADNVVQRDVDRALCCRVVLDTLEPRPDLFEGERIKTLQRGIEPIPDCCDDGLRGLAVNHRPSRRFRRADQPFICPHSNQHMFRTIQLAG